LSPGAVTIIWKHQLFPCKDGLQKVDDGSRHNGQQTDGKNGKQQSPFHNKRFLNDSGDCSSTKLRKDTFRGRKGMNFFDLTDRFPLKFDFIGEKYAPTFQMDCRGLAVMGERAANVAGTLQRIPKRLCAIIVDLNRKGRGKSRFQTIL